MNIQELKSKAQSSDRIIRREVADDKDCPLEILEQLALDPHPKVRCSVALNPNTSVELLIKLSDDEYDSVRRNVADNDKAPGSILKKLSEDKSETVRWYANRTMTQRLFDVFTRE